jgi:hypothetical protein
MNKNQYLNFFIAFSSVIINWVGITLIDQGLTYPSDATCLLALALFFVLLIFDIEVVRSFYLSKQSL